MTLEERIQEAKRSKQFGPLVDAIPYARFLGISVDERDGELTSTLAFSDHIVGNPALPAIHGGVIGAFLETAAIFHLLWERETVQVPKTITVTVDYLRSAGPADTHARAVITKLGARIANVRAEAWQTGPDRPVATANANFLVTPKE